MVIRIVTEMFFICLYKVVRSIDPVEYAEFLEERKKIVEQQLLEVKEKREAKMLRA